MQIIPTNTMSEINPTEHGQKQLDSILSSTKINWCPKYSLKSYSKALEIPKINRNGEIYAAALAAIKRMEESLVPSTKEERAAILFRLRIHYPQAKLSEKAMESIAHDYVRLLGEFSYSTAIMQKVCDEWLVNGKPFFPTIAELNAKMREQQILMQFEHSKLKMLIENATD